MCLSRQRPGVTDLLAGNVDSCSTTCVDVAAGAAGQPASAWAWRASSVRRWRRTCPRSPRRCQDSRRHPGSGSSRRPARRRRSWTRFRGHSGPRCRAPTSEAIPRACLCAGPQHARGVRAVHPRRPCEMAARRARGRPHGEMIDHIRSMTKRGTCDAGSERSTRARTCRVQRDGWGETPPSRSLTKICGSSPPTCCSARLVAARTESARARAGDAGHADGGEGGRHRAAHAQCSQSRHHLRRDEGSHPAGDDLSRDAESALRDAQAQGGNGGSHGSGRDRPCTPEPPALVLAQIAQWRARVCGCAGAPPSRRYDRWLCSPHSFLSSSSHHQRPARSGSPGAIARVQGAQPIEAKPLRVQRIDRNVVGRDIGERLLARPVEQRVELDQAALGVDAHQRQTLRGAPIARRAGR